jgi:hypothetical protein
MLFSILETKKNRIYFQRKYKYFHNKILYIHEKNLINILKIKPERTFEYQI